jgi:hypothetical protein
MKRIGRYRRWLLTVALVVGAAVGLASLPRTQSYAGTSELTSAQIADGVLFNEGPAAKYLTAVTRDPIHWTAELRNVQSSVKNAVESDRSGYFTSQFVPQMESGDPLAVRSAIRRLGETVRKVLDTRYGKNVVDNALQAVGISIIPTGSGTVGGTDNDVAEAVEVAVTLAVAFNTAILVSAVLLIAIIFVPPPGDTTSKAQLAEEMLVNKIATGLRAAHQ